MSSPSLVWVTEDGNLAIGDMPNVGGYRGRRSALQPKHTLALALSESVLEVLSRSNGNKRQTGLDAVTFCSSTLAQSSVIAYA